MNRRLFVFLCVFILLSMIQYPMNADTFSPQDTWFDTDWSYRKNITISNPLDDYQTKITVSKSDDTSDDVDCEGNCNDNFSDLRFTCSNGTLVPYWIEEKTDGDDCTIWIKNEYNDSTLYMYYNNSDATSMSNGTDTFLFFEGFEGGNINQWTGDTGALSTNSTNSFSGQYSLKQEYGNNGEPDAYRTLDIEENKSIAIEYRYRMEDYFGDDNYLRFEDSNNNIMIYINHHREEDKSIGNRLGLGTAYPGYKITSNQNEWHHIIINDIDTSAGEASYYCYNSSGNLVVSNEGENTYSTEQIDQIYISAGTNTFGTSHYHELSYIDNIIIRKWIENPPSFSFSSQESYAPATEEISLNINTWNPSININEHENTSLSYFTINNTGSLAVDIEVNATNSNNWTLASTPAHNQFNLSYNKGSGWNPINFTSSLFYSNLEMGSSVSFGLQLYMPTSSSTLDTQQTIITFTAIPHSDCSEAKSELHTANTANTAYYVDWNEYTPNLSALSDYGYTPTSLSTGYIQYNRSSDGNEAGYWEETIRQTPCGDETEAGRWTCTASTGSIIWRNDTELQNWRDSLGI